MRPHLSSHCYYVYILYREDGVTPFYVGKGKKDRWKLHKYDFCNTHKSRVIQKILEKGLEVFGKKVKQNMTNDEACALEIKLIAELGRHPFGPLTNLTDGGDQGTPGYKHSDAVKAQASARRKGARLSETHKQAFVSAGFAARNSLEGKRKRLEGLHRPDVIAKMDAGRRRPRSEEAKARMKAAQQRPEVREKIRQGNLGKKRTPEQKEHHRIAILNWWASRKEERV